MTDTEKQPDYLGHRQRLRTRFLLNEGKDMADYELLELVLTMAIPRRDVKPLAKVLIRQYSSFANVINAPSQDLLAVDGIKENTLAMLKVIRAAASRVSWQCLQASDQPIICRYDQLVDYCRAEMTFSDIEELRLIYLDTKLRVIGQEIAAKGTINSVAVHPREIAKAAMLRNAASVIMVHNHPSGDVTPSKADVEMTRQIKASLATVGIKLNEHLIISKYNEYSFNNSGTI